MTEPDYRELLEKAQQCTDDVKTFLVAVCNAPHAKANPALLSAAALTVEHLRMVEGQIGHIWELFEAGASTPLAPGSVPLGDPEKTQDEP